MGEEAGADVEDGAGDDAGEEAEGCLEGGEVLDFLETLGGGRVSRRIGLEAQGDDDGSGLRGLTGGGGGWRLTRGLRTTP